MTSIVKATVNDAQLLSNLGKQTFIESHGHSASKQDIDNYSLAKFSILAVKDELQNTDNVFHILYHDSLAIGYSKICYNKPQTNIPFNNVTKLERLYLLEAFQYLKLGLKLFQFNIELSKNHQQAGMWLYTWIENHKAIRFYNKAGFKIIGDYDFRISETHSNPNYQMLLIY